MGEYRPEAYWSRVAQEIDKRESRYVAGDDNPYYRYKRLRFLHKFLDTIDFQSQVVLEVGIGPGGNLQHIATHHRPRKLLGADVSQKMLAIATSNLSPHHAVALTKIDGIALPYPDQSVDTSFTVTVLQHNTDEHMCSSLVHELCRVTKTTIVTIEDIGTNRALGCRGDWIGRRVDVYRSIFEADGFRLHSVEFLNTKVSRAWHRVVFGFYKRAIARQHREGDPMLKAFQYLIGLPMPITRILDDLFVDKRDLAKMVFHRESHTGPTGDVAPPPVERPTRTGRGR